MATIEFETSLDYLAISTPKKGDVFSDRVVYLDDASRWSLFLCGRDPDRAVLGRWHGTRQTAPFPACNDGVTNIRVSEQRTSNRRAIFVHANMDKHQ